MRATQSDVGGGRPCLAIISARDDAFDENAGDGVLAPVYERALSPGGRDLREARAAGLRLRDTEVLLLSSRYGLCSPGVRTAPLVVERGGKGWLWVVKQQLAAALSARQYEEVVACVYSLHRAALQDMPQVTLLSGHNRGNASFREWVRTHAQRHEGGQTPLVTLQLSRATAELLERHAVRSVKEVLQLSRDQLLHLLDGRLECLREIELQLCRRGVMAFSHPVGPFFTNS